MRKAIDLLEESLQILRASGANILLPYWTGALPFALALLLLIHDMSLSWGATLLLRDSLGCAAAFVWLSYWKSRTARIIFLRATSSRIAGEPVPVPLLKTVLLQALFQTMKLFMMPFAIASVLCGPAASLFFRTLALEPQPEHGALQRAFSAATQDYAENLIAFLIVSALTLFAFLNVLILFVIAPMLWRMFTGFETEWSRMGTSVIPSLMVIAATATWLLIDPWLQTYSMLRVFYQNAKSDGRDLLRNLAAITAMAVLCLMPLKGAELARTEQAQTKLDQSVQQVSQSNDYGWLRPQTGIEKGFLANLAHKIRNAGDTVANHVKYWLKLLQYWLRSLAGDQESLHKEDAPPLAHIQELRWTLGFLAALICGGIVALFFRRKSVGVEAAPTPPAAADVLNEQILASDVSQEEWLRVAFEYLSNNQTRLAARAFYLANLSYLGARSLLSLSLTKSNRLYERELLRQPKAGPILPLFAAANRLYELSWYGMRELSAEQAQAIKSASDQLRYG